MNNVKFRYLYRDGSNYKKWGEVVFTNADALSANAITEALRDAFLEDGLFIAHQVRIPEVFLSADDYVTADDHCFHEFDAVEPTADLPSDLHARSIRQFIAEAAREGRHGWRAFDPQSRF